MNLVDLVGWTCAILGSIAIVPQTVKLFRDRNTAGISLPFWQILMGISIAWAHHGLLTTSPTVILPNVITLVCTLVTLQLLRLERHLGGVKVFLPGLLLGVVGAMTDLLLGATAYGLMMALPGIVGISTQLFEIVRAPEVTGLSQGFLILGVVTQIAWLSWGIVTDDVAFLINAGLGTALTGLSYLWYLLRRGGLRPLLTPKTPATVSAPEPTLCVHDVR